MFSNLSNKLQETLSQLTDPHHSATADSALSSSPPTGPSSHTRALDQLTNSLRSLQVQYSPQKKEVLREKREELPLIPVARQKMEVCIPFSL
ncbi:hypothetical protein CALVIDRAFT_569568 [Calocera viscosa TUFC12733]|uniref:Uncharacterized protein n=1 Tax=Calocera viscosa (strain TUFC12733) TaxID=1330018 RepID=A0A167FTZ2_CALVF|nr:hypothetical protein CALVIDRAFT_569568 [Calocera viscosa TUFC12733]